MGAEQSEPGTFLELLSEEDGAALRALGRTLSFERGAMLMHQGEPGDRVLILLEGHVKAGFTDPEGNEMVLSFRGPGDVLGELSFIRAEPRSSNVTAIESVQAQVLTAAQFRAYLEAVPTAALTLIEVISGRFRDANRKRIQFGASDTVGRIAARLVELVERYGEPAEEGVRITLPITQEDLGGWTGSSRAGVADGLRTLRELGWIKTERRQLTVLDLDALAGRAA